MKKQFLLITGFIISISVIAQDKTGFGVKAGITSSKISGDAMNSMKDLLDFTDGMITANSTTGFYTGGFVNIPLSPNLSLEPGLSYSQKGYELRGELTVKGLDFLGANAKAQLKTGYIDMPVLLKANFGGFNITAGPQLSYLTDANLIMKAGVLGFNLFNKKMDASNQLNKWDAAITGGVGYSFNNGLTVSAAYDYGLMKTDSDKNFDAYNRSFKFGVGFKF